MDFYSQEAPAPSSPVAQRDGATEHAKLRRTVRTFVCAGQAIGSRLIGDNVPAGARGVHHKLTVSATLGAAATLELGTATAAAKYAAAATHTVADTPVEIKKAALMDDILAADEQQYLTVGAAALPNDGTIICLETLYSMVD